MGLHVKCRTIKFLENNIGGNLCDLGLDKEFIDLKPKAQSIEGKIEKLDFIKIKTFALQNTSLRG